MKINNCLIPNYQIICQNENQIKINCEFDQDYPYFSGHFPQLPILAGVVQLGLVYHFVYKFWQLDLTKAGLRQVKYQKLVKVNSSLELHLDYAPEKNRIDFKYLLNGTAASSGVFSL